MAGKSVMVRKSTGGWRMCQDYTDLNKSCPKDSFPLPRIDQLVDATAGHELLSFMDAYSGYNQILMHPPDSEHTAFITDKGLYCYNVMPFGLKNAGATYQRLVNKIFIGYIGNIMEVYVDDMLVKSRTAEEHLQNLSIMLGILKDYRMRLNPKKCAFGVSSGKFLGFMISQRGIEANPKKIRHCRQFEQLALALVVSARRLRPYFQAHGIKVLTNQPLRQVLQKSEISDRLIKWVIELREFDIQFVPRPAEKGQAVADFISELTPSTAQSTPEAVTKTVLPDELDAERFDTSTPIWGLHVDGSANQQGCGAGLVLTTPDGLKIEYALRFNFRTSNNEAEYEALLAGLRLAKSMNAQQIRIHSDSQLIVNQVTADFAAKDASMHAYLSTALQLLQSFRAYEIKQIHRGENSHADALARLASAINDKVGGKVPVEILAQPSTVVLRNVYRTDANSLVKKCDKCQRFGNVLHIPAEPLTPIVSPWPFAQWGLDLIGPMPQGKGQVKYVVVAVDYFTKWVEAEPLATITAAKMEDFVWTHICCRFDVPYAIITDNGRQFDSELFRQFCTRLKINLFFASPAHPQSNGQVEAINKIVKKLLKRQLDKAKGAWPEKLPEALWAIRTSYRTQIQKHTTVQNILCALCIDDKVDPGN
ncbi:hypothetical protein L3X38_044330 [Prunus dulcis]|uniref:Uncharacterized protein n=1 Tax=Prunus dulcis TaxID=3755 RepID=A0AAD4UZR1_PRUDU|nr:hypothetical protein L3X38_044330 [Prunus dulcis]